MNSCIVVNFWADTEEKVEIVIKSINQLKKSGKNIIYTSLYPIDKRIQEASFLSLYDEKNEIITFQEYLDNENLSIFSNYTYTTDTFNLFCKPINVTDVTYAMVRQTNINFTFLKSLGYDYIHYFIGDAILCDEDVARITELENRLINENKLGYFENLSLNNFDGFQTLYFCVNIDLYLAGTPKFKSKNDWIQTNKNELGLCFERFLKLHLIDKRDSLIITDNLVDTDGRITMFKNSRDAIDLVSTLDTTNYCVVWDGDNNAFKLIVVPNNTKRISIKINDDITDIELTNNFWYMYGLPSNDFKLEITDDSRNIKLIVNEANVDKLRRNCVLNYTHNKSANVASDLRVLFIISTYPTTEYREAVLMRSMSSVKSPNSDIMLVSHLPLSKEILSQTDYYIFDADNTFLPRNMTANTWFQTDSFKITVYSGGHVVPISRNMYNSLKLAESLDYDFFYFMESDNVISETDFKTLMSLAKEAVETDKIALFFKPENFIVCDSHVYETLLFGGVAREFLKVFTPPNTVEEWTKKEMGYTLELAMFEKLNHMESKFIILPKHSYEVLTSSEMNIFRYNLYIAEIANNINNTNTPILFIAHLNPTKDNARVVVYKNSELLLDENIGYNNYRLFDLSLNGDIIDVTVFENNVVDTHKIFVMSEDNLDKFNDNAQIEFK